MMYIRSPVAECDGTQTEVAPLNHISILLDVLLVGQLCTYAPSMNASVRLCVVHSRLAWANLKFDYSQLEVSMVFKAVLVQVFMVFTMFCKPVRS